MTERIMIYTKIIYDNLSEEEKKALATLKDRFDHFVYGLRHSNLAISFDVEKIQRIASEKEQVLFERTTNP